MDESKKTEKDTIWLEVAKGKRRFQDKESKATPPISSNDLLNDNNSYLLLGDPGSGKTTTLKLIALQILNNYRKNNDDYEYPVLIRLRAMPSEISIARYICFILSLKIESREEFTREGIPVTTYWLFNLSLEFGLAMFLEATKAILLVDGLDEIGDFDLRKNVIRDIENLRIRAPKTKIVLTCRTGDYEYQVHDLKVFSILPLSKKEQKKIANLWLNNSNEFMQQLNATPYVDACSRPLLLTQLIILYSKDGKFPKRPKDIYKKLLMLLIKDWDEERGIDRGSKYASSFDADSKLDFLASLAYHLTYEIKIKQFSHEDLEDAYNLIYESFELPADEASKVAKEIESHNGIIVETSGGMFEFTHLTFQEYLCARHLVRGHYPRLLPKYLKEYPAPIAIAVSLSSNPSIWLAHCILDDRLVSDISDKSIKVLINRIIIEHPKFEVCAELGLIAIELIYKHVINETEASEHVIIFTKQPQVLKSIGSAMGYYEWKFKNKKAYLQNRLDREGPSFIKTPLNPVVPSSIVKEAVKLWGVKTMKLALTGNYILEEV